MVNVKDFEIDHEALKEQYGALAHLPDSNIGMLNIIFARQAELMEKYGPIEQLNGAWVPDDRLHGDLDHRGIQSRIKDMSQRMVEELMEAMNTLKNKPWKQDFKPTNVDHFYEEIADTLHFFVELCIISGMDASDLFSFYMRKSDVNKFRQRSGY